MYSYRFSPSSKFLTNLIKPIAVVHVIISIQTKICTPVCRLQEAKTSFFQRQFSSALKLFRNFLSWEGILSDSALKEIAISSLLNRYLLSAIRVSGFFVKEDKQSLIAIWCAKKTFWFHFQICAPTDAATKSHIIVNTLPRVWLQQSSIVANLDLFIQFLRSLVSQLDKRNPLHM